MKEGKDGFVLFPNHKTHAMPIITPAQVTALIVIVLLFVFLATGNLLYKRHSR